MEQLLRPKDIKLPEKPMLTQMEILRINAVLYGTWSFHDLQHGRCVAEAKILQVDEDDVERISEHVERFNRISECLQREGYIASVHIEIEHEQNIGSDGESKLFCESDWFRGWKVSVEIDDE